MVILYDEPVNFKTEDEFIDCFRRGCELVFTYGGQLYSVTPDDNHIRIVDVNNSHKVTIYDTPQAALDHPVTNGKRIRNILQDMEIEERTLY